MENFIAYFLMWLTLTLTCLGIGATVCISQETWEGAYSLKEGALGLLASITLTSGFAGTLACMIGSIF